MQNPDFYREEQSVTDPPTRTHPNTEVGPDDLISANEAIYPYSKLKIFMRHLLIRIVIYACPLFLFAAALVRYDVYGAVYFLLAIAYHLAYIRHRYHLRPLILLASMCFSVIVVLSRVIYHSILAVNGYYGDQLADAAPKDALSVVGFYKINSVAQAVGQFLPEMLIVIVFAIVWHHRAFLAEVLSTKKALQNAHPIQYPKRHEHRILALLMLLIILSLIVTAISHPSIVTMPYFVYLLFELSLWVTPCKFNRIQCLLRNGILLYTVMHLICFYAFQILFCSIDFQPNWAILLGITKISPSSAYSFVISSCSLLLQFILITVHGAYYVARHSNHEDLVGFSRDFGLGRTVRSFLGRKKIALPMIVLQLSDVIFKCSTIPLITFSVMFPSILSIPLLGWSFVALVLSKYWHQRSCLIAQYYFNSLLCFYFISNLAGTNFKELEKLGYIVLGKDTQTYLAVQTLLFLSFSFFCKRYNVEQTPRERSRSRSIDTFNISINNQDQGRAPESKPPWFYWIEILWKSISELVLEYAYLITLIVLCICGLQEVNIINTVFLIYFILFLIFPGLARIGWLSLVMYTETVICFQFIWHLPFAKTNATDNERLWGLLRTDNLWLQLRFHLIILLFTVIQLETYRHINRKEKEAQIRKVTNQFTDNEEDVEGPNLERERVRTILLTIAHLVKNAFYDNSILLCFLCFSLIGFVDSPTLLNLGYIVLVFLCLLLYECQLSRYLKYFWSFVCLYPGLVVTMCYVYQFEELQTFLFKTFGQDILDSIGLLQKSGKDVFGYLLKHVVALFLCVLQYRAFFFKDRAHLVLNLGLWNSTKLTFKRLMCIHVHKLVLILMALSAFENLAFVGLLIIFTVLVITVVHQRIPKLCIVPLLVFFELFVLSNLAFQLKVVKVYKYDKVFLQYVGYREWSNDVGVVNIPFTILTVYALGLLAAAASWALQQRQISPDLPVDVQDWPIVDITLRCYQNIQEECFNFVDRVNETFQQMKCALSYRLSNFYRLYGQECCIFGHLIVSISRSNLIGLIYLVHAGYLIISGKKTVSRFYWRLYCFFQTLIIIVLYLSYLGMPPAAQVVLPWQRLDIRYQQFLGIYPENMNLMENYILLMLSAFLSVGAVGVPTIWSDYVEQLADYDFTTKPRRFLDQTKYVFVRYFRWIAVIIAFAAGTASITLLNGVLLSFSLYFIAVTTASINTLRPWWFLLGFTYFWFILNKVYQTVTLFFDNAHFRSFGELVGFKILSTQISTELYLNSLILILSLIQIRMSKSHAAMLVANFIRKDSDMSSNRAKGYWHKRQLQVMGDKAKFSEEISRLRDAVVVKKLYQANVQDWIKLFGCRDQARNIAFEQEHASASSSAMESNDISDLRKRKHGSMPVIGDQTFDRATRDQPVGIEQHTNEIISQISPVQDELNANIIQLEDDIVEHRGLGGRLFYGLISFVYALAVNYTDLYVTTSQTELILKAQNDPKLLALIRGIYYVICAHTQIIVYLALWANQIYHGNILSMAPVWSALLWGMLQRPFPSRLFWTFLLWFTEATIILKYIFQFEFLNQTCVNDVLPNSAMTIVGLEKSCGAFSLAVITELILLLCIVTHRGLLKRLGLWDFNLDQKDDLDEGKNVVDNDGSADSLSENGDEDVIHAFEKDGEESSPVMNENIYFSPSRLLLSLRRYVDSSRLQGHDHYLGIFIADFIVFLLTILFWTSFSGDYESNASIEFLSTVFSQNTVPPLFVAIAIVNFCLIVIDRAIYTAKSLSMKLLLQIVTVVAFHMWVFFVLPVSNREPISSSQTLHVWYFMKCVYWYVSCLQLKSGYPELRIRNFLMNNYSDLNRNLFLLYKAIPFVWEMRAIVDWSLADTSFSLYNWLKFEDIFSNLYVVKCSREADRRMGRKFGQRQRRGTKVITGCLMLVAIIFLLWFPLLLLAIPGTTKPNPVYSVNVNLQISGFEPFYMQTVPSLYIMNLTQSQYESMRNQDPYKGLFPSFYSAVNVQKVILQNNSISLWNISPPGKAALINAVKGTGPLFLSFSWEFIRSDPSIAAARGSLYRDVDAKTRYTIAELLNGTSREPEFALDNLFPKAIHAFPSGQTSSLAPEGTFLANCTLKFRQSPDINSVWWELYEGGRSPEFVILSDNIAALSSLSSYGVIGLYVAVVFAVGRFLRMMISDLTLRIMYEDLPEPDALLNMCTDILLAREFKDFETEETLYWQLITIFRSPETLIAKTRIHEQ